MSDGANTSRKMSPAGIVCETAPSRGRCVYESAISMLISSIEYPLKIRPLLNGRIDEQPLNNPSKQKKRRIGMKFGILARM
jgi:hypothetical protein